MIIYLGRLAHLCPRNIELPFPHWNRGHYTYIIWPFILQHKHCFKVKGTIFKCQHDNLSFRPCLQSLTLLGKRKENCDPDLCLICTFCSTCRLGLLGHTSCISTVMLHFGKLDKVGCSDFFSHTCQKIVKFTNNVIDPESYNMDRA